VSGITTFRGQPFVDPLPISGPIYPGPGWWRDRDRPPRRSLYYNRRPPWPTCFSLDGSSSYITIGTSAPAVLASPATWSIAIWTRARKPPTPATSATNLMTAWWAAWGSVGEIGGVLPGTAQGLVATGGGTGTVESAICDFDWHHIVGTYDGSAKQSLYVDGVLVVNAGKTGTPTTSGLIGIGAALVASPTAPVQMWSGQLADARVYSNCLTAANVLEIYNNGYGLAFAGSQSANLIGWWPLNQIAIADQSGQNNPGILVGNARIVSSL
jgi:hypothetical protein